MTDRERHLGADQDTQLNNSPVNRKFPLLLFNYLFFFIKQNKERTINR